MMSHVLVGVVNQSLYSYTEFISQLCRYSVVIENIQNITVTLPYDSIYKVKVLQPLVIIFLRITEEKRVLNAKEVEHARTQIDLWKKSPEAAEGGGCPVKEVPEIIGNTLEYNYSMDQFKNSIVSIFDGIVSEFTEVLHIEKLVMEKIFFPNPRYIQSVSPQAEYVKALRTTIEAKIDEVTAPLMKYLSLFKQYEDFINVDITEYVNSRVNVARKDPESTEIELPVTINLPQILALLQEHFNQIIEIESALPLNPLECGVFLIQVSSVRHILVGKHKDIIQLILSNHSSYCRENVIYLDTEFKNIIKSLAKKT